MALGLCAMHVDYVGFSVDPVSKVIAHKITDYAKLTRKMGGSKVSSNTSNIRPKDVSVNSPQ